MEEIKKIATRESYGNALVECAEDFPQLVVLDADLAEIKLSVGTAVDTEIGTLVGIIFQLINRVDHVHVVSPRVSDIVTVRIVRHCPWNHGVQCIIIITRSRYRLREVITIVLGTV